MLLEKEASGLVDQASQIDVIEVIGGLLLIVGLHIMPAAAVLAGDMVGAIIVSGIARGDAISLTLAPAELVAMLVLLWTGTRRHVPEAEPTDDSQNSRGRRSLAPTRSATPAQGSGTGRPLTHRLARP